MGTQAKDSTGKQPLRGSIDATITLPLCSSAVLPTEPIHTETLTQPPTPTKARCSKNTPRTPKSHPLLPHFFSSSLSFSISSLPFSPCFSPAARPPPMWPSAPSVSQALPIERSEHGYTQRAAWRQVDRLDGMPLSTSRATATWLQWLWFCNSAPCCSLWPLRRPLWTKRKELERRKKSYPLSLPPFSPPTSNHHPLLITPELPSAYSAPPYPRPRRRGSGRARQSLRHAGGCWHTGTAHHLVSRSLEPVPPSCTRPSLPPHAQKSTDASLACLPSHLPPSIPPTLHPLHPLHPRHRS